MSKSDSNVVTSTGSVEYVTVIIGGQLFGLPIERVQDVFTVENMTRIPLSQNEIAGVLNLRGRIVTAIDMRKRLRFSTVQDVKNPIAVGIEKGGESYGLIIDKVGEVLRLTADEREPNPTNLDPRWAKISEGVYRLDGQLMVILNVEKVLDMGTESQAA